MKIPLSDLRVGDVTNIGTVIAIKQGNIPDSLIFETDRVSDHTDNDGVIWYTMPTTSIFCPRTSRLISIENRSTT